MKLTDDSYRKRIVLHATKWLGVVFCVLFLLSACTEDLGVDQYGKTVSHKQISGRWLVLSYWSGKCKSYFAELNELNQLNAYLDPKVVRVLGVNTDHLQGKALREESERLDIKFTVLEQDPKKTFNLSKTDSLPITYIIDPHGQLRDQLLGVQSKKVILRRLYVLKAINSDDVF